MPPKVQVDIKLTERVNYRTKVFQRTLSDVRTRFCAQVSLAEELLPLNVLKDFYLRHDAYASIQTPRRRVAVGNGTGVSGDLRGSPYAQHGSCLYEVCVKPREAGRGAGVCQRASGLRLGDPGVCVCVATMRKPFSTAVLVSDFHP